ncbi:hypothetical protein DFA_10424 [Cavenderia fasciculata]|uniref:Countin-like protein n=1 Tax=Cavenderia fasciculata TaxID=261658 RepID=F4QA63_CACFS|nr:uncharacterized protein DFA_10424 [Cavenderia fasciculata]EGG15582.1 hypothetical protein DFA_10424 [Cavenderia fasciculata]|eukprot:XP_004354324.1 hypothetical protein DFA_10424 [Cavenderia fasciculata]
MKLLSVLLIIASIALVATTVSGSAAEIERSSSSSSSDDGLSPCSTCVSSINFAYNKLYDIATTGGSDIATCGQICIQLPDRTTIKECNTTCNAFGVKEFVAAILVDRDPIYYCQVAQQCQGNNDGAAADLSFFAAEMLPTGQINVTSSINVISYINYGEMRTVIAGPQGNITSNDYLIGYDPNQFLEIQIRVSTTTWPAGDYKAYGYVCAASCFSQDSGSRVLYSTSATFTVPASEELLLSANFQ